MDRITLSLNKIFETHRIVFWYDVKKELRSDYETVAISDVEKVEVRNNHFYIKHLVLRERPDQKFLLYFESERPADKDNWLLDVELAYGEFRSDRSSIWLGELGLGYEFANLMSEHEEFFKNNKLRAELVKLIDRSEKSDDEVRLKMLAVCSSTDPRVDSLMEELLKELSIEKTAKFDLIKASGLESYLWRLLESSYAYRSPRPSLKDFAFELFKSAFQMGVAKSCVLNHEAVIFIKRWKNNRHQTEAFEKLSAVCERDLDIENAINRFSLKELSDVDYFQIIDKKILRDLINDLANKTISPQDCLNYISNRKSTHWYKELGDIYEAVHHAAHFFRLLDEVNLVMLSIQDGVKKYTDNWYKVDLNYRKFIYYVRKSAQTTLLAPLIEQIENLYTNRFLLPLGNLWQEQIDSCSNWDSSSYTSQRKFYTKWIAPVVEKNNKIYVIISDALRFEVGMELRNRIMQMDRYEVEIESALTVLPSYTALGMAALLPHKEIGLNSDKIETVLVDGQNSAGIPNRGKILSEATKGKGAAISKEELMKMNIDQSRDLARANDVVYVYHDEIDNAGKSEDPVFTAVESTFDSLIALVKKLANANANRIIITADHGFIYQDKEIEESDFLSETTIHGEVLRRDRRFLIGKNLSTTGSYKVFSSADLNLVGDITVAIPKSINRLRLKGSSIRFVHGGATLQEIVIPILDIKKKRESDLKNVSIDIISSSSSVITTGQLAVAFYQTQPISNKERPLVVRAGLYYKETLLSDVHELTFDFTSTDPREREKRVQFILSKEANSYNNAEVELRLHEKIKDTERFEKIHKTVKYTLRRSINSDFDF